MLRQLPDVWLCLVDIKAWLKASRLRLNPTKSQMMWLGSQQQLDKVNVSEVMVASSRINVSETALDLIGVVIDSQLTLSVGYNSDRCVTVAINYQLRHL